MTTSATSTFELSRDTIIRRAFQIAGMFPSSQDTEGDDVALAADILQTSLVELVTSGSLLTWVTRTTQALTSGTAEYTITDALDIYVDVNGLAGTIVQTAGGETPVRAITRSDYMAISNKTTTATPSLVWVERLATVKLVFWPTPSDSTTTFRYQKIRYPRDMSDGDVTLDLSKRWQKAIMWQLAAELALAKSMPLDRVQYLEGKAEALLARAQSSDRENAPAQLVVGRY